MSFLEKFPEFYETRSHWEMNDDGELEWVEIKPVTAFPDVVEQIIREKKSTKNLSEETKKYLDEN